MSSPSPKAAQRERQGTGPSVRELARSMLDASRAEFRAATRSRRFAFTTMRWVLLVVLLTALGTMIAAVRVAITVPDTGFEWSQAGVVAALGGASILLFGVLFYTRPLATLERNSVIDAFLTVVVNSYWTRLLHADEAEDIGGQINEATEYATEHLAVLLDRQLLGVSRYMDLVRRQQEGAGDDPEEYRTPL